MNLFCIFCWWLRAAASWCGAGQLEELFLFQVCPNYSARSFFETSNLVAVPSRRERNMEVRTLQEHQREGWLDHCASVFVNTSRLYFAQHWQNGNL